MFWWLVRQVLPSYLLHECLVFFSAPCISIIMLKWTLQVQQNQINLSRIYIVIMIALNLELSLDGIDIFIIRSLPICQYSTCIFLLIYLVFKIYQNYISFSKEVLYIFCYIYPRLFMFHAILKGTLLKFYFLTVADIDKQSIVYCLKIYIT